MKTTVLNAALASAFALGLFACGGPRPAGNESVESPAGPSTPGVPSPSPTAVVLQPGTYLVGSDMQPGIYRRDIGTDGWSYCEWARLKYVTDESDAGALTASDGSIGPFYVEVLATDFAFRTECELVLLPSLPQPQVVFPETIGAGVYLVGIDIQPGTYRGGPNSRSGCIVHRLDRLSGIDSPIECIRSDERFEVDVASTDLALRTTCRLTIVVAPTGQEVAAAATPISLASPVAANVPPGGLPGRIVFLSDRSGNPDLYMMDAEGTNQRAMRETVESESEPLGDPSGQIFFTADYDGDPEIYRTFTMGFFPTRWTVSPGMDMITDIAPQGGFPILFWSQRDPVEGFEGPPPEIYMQDLVALGTGVTRLTNNTTSDTCAAWSADMSQIGYSSYRHDYESVRIVIMNADGSDPRDLIDTPADDYCPQWSRDGGSIAFYTDDPACFPSQCGELWLMDPDGTDAHALSIFEGAAIFRGVRWSPRGEWLVFSADVGAGFDVYLVRPDGSDLLNLTQDSPANDWGADWFTLR